jgi:hypothetical protein
MSIDNAISMLFIAIIVCCSIGLIYEFHLWFDVYLLRFPIGFLFLLCGIILVHIEIKLIEMKDNQGEPLL